MSTVLVTGGCGFIGSHVIDELLNDPKVEKIINVDKLGVGSDVNNVSKDNRVTNYYIDICSEKIREVFETHKPTHVIHLAAESHVDRSIASPMQFVHSNVVGTGMILECVRTITPNAKLIHVSTDEVYGHLEVDGLPFNESTSLAPRSPYSASKASSDVLALSYRTTYDLDITVTRCCNNYGPRQHDEKLIPTIIKSLINGKKIPVYGKGDNVREWIYVGDHAKALVELCFSDYSQQIYNIYGVTRQVNISLINHIVTMLIDMDSKYIREGNSYIEFVKDRPGHDKCYKMSTLYTDIKTLTKQMTFSSGLLKTLLYYKERYEKEN